MEKELKMLKEVIRKDAVMIPQFIDKTKAIDRTCYEMAVHFFECLDRLIVPIVLSKRKINYIVNDIELIFNEMSIVSGSLTLHYFSFIDEMLHYYINFCQKEELWEVAANIKSFYEALFKQKWIVNNE